MPIPVLIGMRVWQDLTTPVASNPQFGFFSISIYGCIQTSYCYSQNIDIGTLLFVLDILAAFLFNTNSHSLYQILRMSVNGESKTFGLVSLVMKV